MRAAMEVLWCGQSGLMERALQKQPGEVLMKAVIRLWGRGWVQNTLKGCGQFWQQCGSRHSQAQLRGEEV